MFDIFNMVMFAIGKPTSNSFFHQNHSQVLVPLRPTTTRKEVQKVGVLADELLHRGFFGRKGLLFLNRHAIENYLLLGLNQQRVRQIRNAIWEKGSGLGAEWEGEDEELNIFGSLLYFKVK